MSLNEVSSLADLYNSESSTNFNGSPLILSQKANWDEEIYVTKISYGFRVLENFTWKAQDVLTYFL